MGDLEDLRAEVERLKGMVEQMREDMESLNELRAVEIAQSKRRISKLEEDLEAVSSQVTRPPCGDITKERLRRADQLLFSNPAMTFKELGQRLDFGEHRRQNMTKFSRVLKSYPDRYIIEPATKGHSKRVRLTLDWREHLNDSSKRSQIETM